MSILAMYYRIGSGMRGIPWIAQGPAVWITAVFMTLSAVANFLVSKPFHEQSIFTDLDIGADAHLLPSVPSLGHRTTVTGLCQPSIVHASLGRDQRSHGRSAVDFPSATAPAAEGQQETAESVISADNPSHRLTVLLAALAVIFSVGLVPVVASTMRLCEIVMAGNPVVMGKTWQEEDSSWYESNACLLLEIWLMNIHRTWAWIPIWSHIEVEVGIIVASLPSLNPLVKQMCAGTSTRRPSTPSELPDFPDYQASWTSTKLSSDVDSDGEKSHKGTSFYDESSDFEDDIGVAKATTMRTIEKPLAAEVTGSKRWWRRQK
jgi:hypothetical protein